MKILRRNKGEVSKYATYTRADMGPITDAVEDVTWFILEESERPNPDPRLYSVVEEITETERKNEIYPHFLVAVQSFKIEQLGNDEIVDNLNASLGAHLDEQYPEWKRIKHISEMMMGTTPEREAYIRSLKTWEFDCRAARDKKESDLLIYNQLPAFDWEPAPNN